MSDMIKKPYEISLWDDILVFDIYEMNEIEVNEDSFEENKYYYLDGDFVLAQNWEEGQKYYCPGKLLKTEEGKLSGESYNTYVKVYQYYKERKLCVIGSDTMESPGRAIQPKLVSNINGANTLTFNLYYRYYDEDIDDMVFNPFHKLLTNERKIKLRYGALGATDTKWYDLIIKNVQENSESKTFTYTCKDQFVNELSKSGFNIQLDTELENNMGNIEKLANTVLEDSDWKLKDYDVLKQYKEEPLYEIVLNDSIQCTALNLEEGQTGVTSISKGKIIYAFYSMIANKDSELQFLYTEDNKFQVDEDHVIDRKHPNYLVTGVSYKTAEGKEDEPIFASSMNFTSDYRGDRLVRQPITRYDPTIDKYVKIYDADKDEEKVKEIYVYTESEYISPTIVQNFVTNPSEFENSNGWSAVYISDLKEGVQETQVENVIENDSKQALEDAIVKGEAINFNEYKSYIKFTHTTNYAYLKNSGPKEYLSKFSGYSRNDKYIVRLNTKIHDHFNTPSIEDVFIGSVSGKTTTEIRYLQWDKRTPTLAYERAPIAYNPNLIYYTKKEEKYSEATIQDVESYDWHNYYIFAGYDYVLETSPVYYNLEKSSEGVITRAEDEIKTDKINLSYSDMITNLNLGLFFSFSTKSITEYIISCSLFQYVTDIDGNMCVPGGDIKSGVKTKYYGYYPNPEFSSIDDVEFEYIGYEEPDYRPMYDNNYEKVRSITATESNRFNLIQDLCETFESWAKFEIEHNSLTGEILLGKDVYIDDKKIYIGTEDEKYRQQKWISFHEYIGASNYAGFKYGINLKSIQRTLDSEGIVTKMVVKNNANEFAESGFCSIARAEENPSGENFILDFSYYIQQQMLDWDTVINDLYVDVNGYLGFYKKLKEQNVQRDSLIKTQSALFVDLSKYEANVTTYKVAYEAAYEELQSQLAYFKKMTSYTYKQLQAALEKPTKDNEKIRNWLKQEEALATASSIIRLTSLSDQYYDYYLKALDLLDYNQKQYDQIDSTLDEIAEIKSEIIYEFYKKYSRFLQEGSWINEDYIDDNLYYIDAQSTLITSAKPKVTYNISVLELSQLEGYENYRFALGDKTYIEDTEYFGWTDITGVLTPYHEEIVVTELTINLDQPESNSIKVQNYKTQFEDLFQRMAATTQSVEYHTGEYAKTATVITAQGTIEAGVLQNSFTNNSFVLANAKDQSVVWDSFGITTTSLSKPNEIVRLVSGGLFLSNDGGVSFNTGITGSGINANYITTGQLNTSVVNIMSGSFPTFRWDSMGLNAYHFVLDANNNPINFNYGNFVRMDQYGVYGILGEDEFNPNIEEVIEESNVTKSYIGENKIWKNASFALTWKGFILRNDEGTVEISSSEDIVVKDSKKINRIQIGRIGTFEEEDNEGNKTTRTLYGIRICDNTEATVMETDDSGKLWLRKELNVGTSKTSKVAIGYLDGTREVKVNDEVTEIHEVIHAGDGKTSFIVYEDGKLVAQGVEIEGSITAESGTIGGLSVNQWKEMSYSVKITSSAGEVIKIDSTDENTQATILTATLYRGSEPVTDKNLHYTWIKINADGSTTTLVENSLDNSWVVEEEVFDDQNNAQYLCTITDD